MASSGSSTAGSSGDRPGAAEVSTNAARVSADMWRIAATAVANAAEAVGPEADNWNEAMRDAVAAQKGRDPPPEKPSKMIQQGFRPTNRA